MVLDENHSQLEMIMRIIINIKKEMIMRIIINIKKEMKMKMRIIINSWAKERALSSTPGGLTVCFSSSMELRAICLSGGTHEKAGRRLIIAGCNLG